MSKLSKIAKTKNEIKRRMRDNETTPIFTWKTSKEIKNHGFKPIKNSTMKSNQGVQGFT